MIWALAVPKSLLTVVFLFAGGAKLAGAKPLAEQFREFGQPRWAMPLVGLLEIAGAVGLWVNPLVPWASSGLAALMAGAVVNHLKVRHPLSKLMPSLVLLVLCLLVAGAHILPYLNRPS